MKIFNLKQQRLFKQEDDGELIAYCKRIKGVEFSSMGKVHPEDWDIASAKMFRHCKFTYIHWRRLHASRAWISECSFRGCQFKPNRGVPYPVSASFVGASLEGTEFLECEFSFGKFERSDLTGCGFYETALEHCTFIGANLTGCVFEGSYLHNCTFTGAYYSKGCAPVGLPQDILKEIKEVNC